MWACGWCWYRSGAAGPYGAQGGCLGSGDGVAMGLLGLALFVDCHGHDSRSGSIDAVELDWDI